MHSRQAYRYLILILVLAASLGGCPQAGPAAAVPDTSRTAPSLAGTWLATGVVSGASASMTITIDANNKLTNIHIDPPGVDLSPAANTVVQVNGTTVDFATSFPLGAGSMSFQGTMNDAHTTMSGTLTARSTAVVGTAAQSSDAIVFTKQ